MMPNISYLSEIFPEQRPKICKHLELDSGESFCTEVTVSSDDAVDVPTEVISEHITNIFSHLKDDLLPNLTVMDQSTEWKTPWTITGWVDSTKVVEELSSWWIFRARRLAAERLAVEKAAEAAAAAAAAAEVVSNETQ